MNRIYLLKVAFHSVGLACVTAAVLLGVYTFFKIVSVGGIIYVEPILPLAIAELGLSLFALCYFGYVFQKTIRETVRGAET